MYPGMRPKRVKEEGKSNGVNPKQGDNKQNKKKNFTFLLTRKNNSY